MTGLDLSGINPPHQPQHQAVKNAAVGFGLGLTLGLLLRNRTGRRVLLGLAIVFALYVAYCYAFNPFGA